MKHQFKSDIAQAIYPVLCAICRDKDSFAMEEHANGHTLTLSAEAALDDYRILVGAKGRTVHAIQRVVKRAGDRSQCDARFELNTNHVGGVIKVHQFTYNPRFDEAGFVKLLKALCQAVDLDFSHARISSTPDRKLCVVIPTDDIEDRSTVKDLGDCFFPYGFNLGRRIDIKPET